MRKNILVAFLGLVLTVNASAVTIEGQTPSGGNQQVGVTEQGYLQVSAGGSAVQNVTVVAPIPLPVGISTFGVSGSSLNPVTVDNTSVNPVPVNVTGGSIMVSSVSAVPPATAVTLYGNGSSSGDGFIVMPANASRYQSTIINECGLPGVACGAYLRVGDNTVTGSAGYMIPPGGTYSPDTPASFTGELFGASTATVQWSWISH